MSPGTSSSTASQSRTRSGRRHGCQMAIARFLDRMCLALRASGRWLRYAALQNLIPSFPWIAPGWRVWGARKGRDQILPSGNLLLDSSRRQHCCSSPLSLSPSLRFACQKPHVRACVPEPPPPLLFSVPFQYGRARSLESAGSIPMSDA